MSLLTEYQNIRTRMDEVIDTQGLDALEDGLKRMISESADYVVYSYPATERAMKERRYTIGKEQNLNVSKSHFELAIENIAKIQNGEENEATMVEEGWKAYRQPYPRPFMAVAADAYAGEAAQGNSYAEKDLLAVLHSNGF